MIHQRNVLAVIYIVEAIAGILLIRFTGIYLAIIIVTLVALPITALVKKILPAPDWYANEDEGSKVTGLNLNNDANNKS